MKQVKVRSLTMRPGHSDSGELSTGERSYQQGRKLSTKKTEMKREHSPYNPYKRKAKGKETRPGYIVTQFKTACARASAYGVSAYAVAGAAADELIGILGGDPARDRGIWAWYCYHHDADIILDKAYECAARYRQGEIRNPITAFQRWLGKSFGKEA